MSGPKAGTGRCYSQQACLNGCIGDCRDMQKRTVLLPGEEIELEIPAEAEVEGGGVTPAEKTKAILDHCATPDCPGCWVCGYDDARMLPPVFAFALGAVFFAAFLGVFALLLAFHT